MKTGYSVADIMTNKPVCVGLDTSLRDAAKEMVKFKINSVLVIEDDEPVGILTDQDFVRKVVAESKNPDSVKVEDVMSRNLVTIRPGEDVYDALLVMRDHGIRRLPVVQDDKLVGFLSMNDVLKIQPELFDIVVERIQLREQERKLATKTEREEDEEF